MTVTFRVGAFLALRQLRRTSRWTRALIVLIMTLTFLNLVVINGILTGLVEGSSRGVRQQYSGDVLVTTLPTKTYIDRTAELVDVAGALPDVRSLSARLLEPGRIEANYQSRLRQSDLADEIGTLLAGIDPVAEDEATGLSRYLAEGEYLQPGDTGYVLIGSIFLKERSGFGLSDRETLTGVDVGSKLRVKVGDSVREVTVKGILESKVDEMDRRLFFVAEDLASFIGRADGNADEVAIVLQPGADPEATKAALLSSGFGSYATVQTWEEAQGKFFKDLRSTFNLLGGVIGGIGIAVAAITLFIVIFINAITRRKYIGILKGIGISPRSIQWSYVLQSAVYGIVGAGLGWCIVFGLLRPYFDANPIDFPFGDGIMVATVTGTAIRTAVLLLATLAAGYLPARMVIRGNTLDAILGR